MRRPHLAPPIVARLHVCNRPCFADQPVSLYSDAAEKAFKTVWGEKVPGHARGKMLMDLAVLFEEHADTIASIESLGTSRLHR